MAEESRALPGDPGIVEEVPGADSELIEAIAKLGDRLVVLLKPSTIFVGLGELAAQAA